MTFPSVEELTPERFQRQVWVELHPVYERRLVFQSAAPYFLFNHRDTGWFSEHGVLNDLTKADEVISALEGEGFEVVVSDEAERLLDSLDESRFVLPDGMYDRQNGDAPLSLYVFQRRGLLSIAEQPSALLNWDTGAGKTIGALVLAMQRLQSGEVSRVVVWCPNHLVTDWSHAVVRWTGIEPDRLDKGSKQKRMRNIAEAQSPVWVINYEKVRCSDYDALVQRLRDDDVMFIYDEVQRLKNRTSSVHKQMVKLVKAVDVKYQLALSATPVEKSPVDFYNLFRLLEPDLFGRVKDFEEQYTLYGGAKDMFYRYVGFQNLDDMRNRAGHAISVARKTDPAIRAEFPDLQEVLVTLELSPQDRKLYDKVLALARSEGQQGMYPSFVDAARRVCSLPESLLIHAQPAVRALAESTKGVEDSRYSTKLAATLELVSNIIEQGEKVLVFYSLTNHGILLMQRHFEQFDPVVYHGGMSNDEKAAAVAAFKESDSRHLMLVSDAGREGLNIPQASYVIHYDTPYLWSHYKQRSDRVHRIDSDKQQVTVYRFLTENTIEERIEAVMQERLSLAVDLGVGADVDDAVLQRLDIQWLLFGEEG